MAMLINRSPVDPETLKAINDELLHDRLPDRQAIGLEDVTFAGGRILRPLEVEGKPADGIALHGSRFGRRWCAFIRVD